MQEKQRVIVTLIWSPFCGKTGHLVRLRKHKRFGQKTWYVDFDKPAKVQGGELTRVQLPEYALAVIPEDYGELYRY